MLRCRGSTSVTSSSSMKTRPESGVSSPPMSLRSVDLPAPDGPRIAVSDPEGTSAFTSSTPKATPKRLVTSLSEIDTQAPFLRSQDRQQHEHRHRDEREDDRAGHRADLVVVLLPGVEDVDG